MLRSRPVDILVGMSALSSLLYNLWCFFGVVGQLLWYGVRSCRDLLLSKAVLVARLTASESQLRELTDRLRRETGAPCGPAC